MLRALTGLLSLVALALLVGCASSASSDSNSPYDDGTVPGANISPGDIAAWRAGTLPDLLGGFGKSSPTEWEASAREILAQADAAPKYIQEWLLPGLDQLLTSEARKKHGARWITEHRRAVRQGFESGEIIGRLKAAETRVRTPVERTLSGERLRLDLAREGVVYRQLAKFNTADRGEWSRARQVLCEMSESERNRCIATLVLRLNSQPRITEGDVASSGVYRPTTQRDPSTLPSLYEGRAFSSHMSVPDFEEEAKMHQLGVELKVDTALWAMHELKMIGEATVPYLIFALYLSEADVMYTIQGSASGRFRQLVALTLVQLGETAVPLLLEDLRQSDEIADPGQKFNHKRELIRILGDIYSPEKWTDPDWLAKQLSLSWRKDDMSEEEFRQELDSFPDRYVLHRPAWQEDPKHRGKVISALAEQAEHYDPGSDTRRYMIQLGCVKAFYAIGHESAVPALVDIWAENAWDDDLVIEIKVTLRYISPRMLNSLAEWQRFAATLPDPRQ